MRLQRKIFSKYENMSRNQRLDYLDEERAISAGRISDAESEGQLKGALIGGSLGTAGSVALGAMAGARGIRLVSPAIVGGVIGGSLGAGIKGSRAKAKVQKRERSRVDTLSRDMDANARQRGEEDGFGRYVRIQDAKDDQREDDYRKQREMMRDQAHYYRLLNRI